MDFSKIRALTAEEIIPALLAVGFFLRKGRGGSHRRYQHPDVRRVTVAYHGSNGEAFAQSPGLCASDRRPNPVPLNNFQ